MQTEEYAKMRSLEDRYWWFVARRELALDLVDRHLPAQGKILDIGCGTGAVLEQLQKRSWAGGVDFSPHALQFSEERGLANLTLGDAQALPYEADQFDLTISLDTIEHVPDDERALREIYRTLKPGGTFIMNVPAFRWLWGPHDVALMHFRRYTRREVADKLAKAGFEVERVNYSVFFLFPIVVLKRLSEKFATGEPEVKLPQVSDSLNQKLIQLMRREANLSHRLLFPWGSSVVAIARKPTSPKSS